MSSQSGGWVALGIVLIFGGIALVFHVAFGSREGLTDLLDAGNKYSTAGGTVLFVVGCFIAYSIRRAN